MDAASDDLLRLGWDERWARAAPGGVVVRVIAEHRGAYQAAGAGGMGWAELPGKQFRAAKDKRDLPTVGDWVVVERWPQAIAGNGAAVVRAVLPRRTLLVRRAAGERAAPQPLAANVDLGLVVTSATQELSPRRLERYLAVLRDAGVTPIIVLNKTDLVADPSAAVASIAALAPELCVIATSAISPGGVDALRAKLGNATSVLLGSSGVGKSTLLNRLVERDVQDTRPIDDEARGRHTTTRRELFVLPADGHEPASGAPAARASGGVVIDTPGMRELGLWSDGDDDDSDAATLADFAEVTALAASCRFADCRHAREPGCAVVAAVETGELTRERAAGFVKLCAEQRDTGRRAEATRRAAERGRGATHDARRGDLGDD